MSWNEDLVLKLKFSFVRLFVLDTLASLSILFCAVLRHRYDDVARSLAGKGAALN